MTLSDTAALVRARAAFLAQLRAFFHRRQVLEVDTPLLAPWGNPDPALANVRTAAGDYLQTSPEFAMKVLLSRGAGDIYQLNHVFRGEEQGRHHRGEFLMAEWYRLGFDHWRLMEEVAELVRELVPRYGHWPRRHRDYCGLFLEYCGFDPAHIDSTALAERSAALLGQELDLDFNGHLDLLFSLQIQPQLGREALDFVVNFLPSQASLARLIVVNGAPRAARFELFINGLELCNGFWELTDRAEQARRFAAENAARAAQGLEPVPADPRLLAALAQGLPDCAGVALGVERMLMLALEREHIEAVGYRLDF